MKTREKTKVDMYSWELTWNLNFEERSKSEISFSQKVWTLTQVVITDLNGDNVSDINRANILFLSKSLRLLRSICILTMQGYWPEAEIIFRTLLEAQLCLTYILDDKSGKRASKWFSMVEAVERWPVKEFLKEFLDGQKPNIYEKLSLYTHSHLMGMGNFLIELENDRIKLEIGPMTGAKNFEKSRELLGFSAMTVGGMIELVGPSIYRPEIWEKKHSILEEDAYYQESIKKFSELGEEKQEEVLKMVARHVG